MICHFYIPHTTAAKVCTEGFEHILIPTSYSQTTIWRILSITLLSDDGPHSVEEPSELWIGLGLVMNELDLDGLHGAHNHNGLRYPSPKTCYNQQQNHFNFVVACGEPEATVLIANPLQVPPIFQCSPLAGLEWQHRTREPGLLPGTEGVQKDIPFSPLPCRLWVGLTSARHAGSSPQ